MATTTNVAPLKINYLTQDQYNTALANDQINDDEIYLTNDFVLPLATTESLYTAIDGLGWTSEVIS